MSIQFEIEDILLHTVMICDYNIACNVKDKKYVRFVYEISKIFTGIRTIKQIQDLNFKYIEVEIKKHKIWIFLSYPL